MLALSGCGTVVNLSSRQQTEFTDATKPYGGVCVDAAFAGMFASQPQSIPVALGVLIDVPFSLIGDTLTLPYVLYVNAHKDRPADVRPDKPEEGGVRQAGASDATPGATPGR
jgi:uncharacterized protein YceK